MNVNEIITGKMIQSIADSGKLPWHRPWNAAGFRNITSGHAYRGINVIMLSIMGNNDTAFLTYNQARANGGNVRKGSKGIPIVFWQKFEKSETRKASFMARYFTVFALKDCEGLPKLEAKREAPQCVHEPIQRAEAIVQAMGIEVTHGGNRACYSPSSDKISMPLPESFKSSAHYYATLFHEITHATLARIGGKHDGSFGSENYSKEELIAEMGANFLLSHCGIDSSDLFDNSQGYLSSWLSAIKGNPSLLISAASNAQKRFDYILLKTGVQAEALPEECEEVAA